MSVVLCAPHPIQLMVKWRKQCDDVCLCLLTSLWTHRHVATQRSLDRIYCNADIQVLSELHPVIAVHGSAALPPGGSDHWPVRLNWMDTHSRAARHGLPRYMSSLASQSSIIPLCVESMWMVHVSAMEDVDALQWIHSTCKAARAEMLQEEAHAEFTAESTESPSLKSDFLLRMLTHWRRQQWAGQPGVAHCS
eukprot:2900250-Amphidinium_carterae.2